MLDEFGPYGMQAGRLIPQRVRGPECSGCISVVLGDLDEAVPSDAVDVSVVWTVTSAKHGGVVGSAGDLL